MACPEPGMTASRMKNLWLTVFLGVILVTGSASAVTEAEPRLLLKPVTRPFAADDFGLKTLNGKRVRMSGLRGKAVLLNFWATWCPPCIQEMPSMETLYQRYRSRGLAVLAVSLDRTSPAEVKTFVDKLGLHFMVLLDPDGLTSALYSVSGVPYSFLINSEGRIMYKAAGAIDWESPDVRATVETLLPETKSEER